MQNDEGQTALFLASEAGSLDAVNSLLETGASLETAASTGWTPLFVASFNGHLEIVESLAEAGARLSIFDPRGETPLHAASRNGCAQKISRVSISCCIYMVLSKFSMPYWSACWKGMHSGMHGTGITNTFHCARICRQLTVVGFLLSKGLNPEVVDNGGVSSTTHILDAVNSGDATLGRKALMRVVEEVNMTITNNAVSLISQINELVLVC